MDLRRAREGHPELGEGRDVGTSAHGFSGGRICMGATVCS